jgi:polyisoprenoid-binding protein YceI
MKKISIFLILLINCHWAHSQQYMTRSGFIGFYGKTPMEDIRAENKQVYAIIDAGKKEMAITLLLRGFIFTKELMQQHFNENYVESDKYPKASFTGTYTINVPPGSDSIYKITIKGNMTLHNVTRPVEIPATLQMQQGRLIGNAEFKMKPEDYNITIPSLVRDKIAKEMDVVVKLDCNTK